GEPVAGTAARGDEDARIGAVALPRLDELGTAAGLTAERHERALGIDVVVVVRSQAALGEGEPVRPAPALAGRARGREALPPCRHEAGSSKRSGTWITARCVGPVGRRSSEVAAGSSRGVNWSSPVSLSPLPPHEPIWPRYQLPRSSRAHQCS